MSINLSVSGNQLTISQTGEPDIIITGCPVTVRPTSTNITLFSGNIAVVSAQWQDYNVNGSTQADKVTAIGTILAGLTCGGGTPIDLINDFDISDDFLAYSVGTGYVQSALYWRNDLLNTASVGANTGTVGRPGVIPLHNAAAGDQNTLWTIPSFGFDNSGTDPNAEITIDFIIRVQTAGLPISQRYFIQVGITDDYTTLNNGIWFEIEQGNNFVPNWVIKTSAGGVPIPTPIDTGYTLTTALNSSNQTNWRMVYTYNSGNPKIEFFLLLPGGTYQSIAVITADTTPIPAGIPVGYFFLNRQDTPTTATLSIDKVSARGTLFPAR